MIQIFTDYLSFEKERVEEKPWNLVKKAFLKKPFLHLLMTLITGGYHLNYLRKKALRTIKNTKAARKVIFCIQAQQKIDRIKSEEACTDRLLEKVKKETIGIHRLDEIYSHEELLKLIHHPVNEEALLASSYFLQKPYEAWLALRTHSSSPCDIDRINVYYEELKQKRSLSHEDVLHLVDRKIQGRRCNVVSLEDLDGVFQELLDDVL